ncbi:MAG: SDR family NAD(P)-dependent oxidoreductase [Bacteroidales bacterium]|nr:SDR family NAD(P)-dependent oxidoreductase [Bacteroidales bacterium]
MYTERNKEKRTVLITGAGSGIGLEYAKNLANRNCDLVLVDIQEQKIIDVADSLSKEFHISTFPVCLDLTADKAAETLFDFCQTKDLQIDILISNAGFLIFNEIDRISNARVRNLIRLQVETPTMLCKLFGSEMKKRRFGYILVTSSLSAWMPYPGLMMYSSTKRYLKDFTKALHYEMVDYNVGVTAICPGAVNTPLYNLSDRYRKIALNTGIMMNADKLAAKGIKAMFRKRVKIIPGLLNKIALPLIVICPMWLIQFIKRKTKILDKITV